VPSDQSLILFQKELLIEVREVAEILYPRGLSKLSTQWNGQIPKDAMVNFKQRITGDAQHLVQRSRELRFTEYRKVHTSLCNIVLPKLSAWWYG
jgi:hypothetical protein